MKRRIGQLTELGATAGAGDSIYECRRQSSQKHTSLVCLRETRRFRGGMWGLMETFQAVLIVAIGMIV